MTIVTNHVNRVKVVTLHGENFRPPGGNLDWSGVALYI